MSVLKRQCEYDHKYNKFSYLAIGISLEF